MIIIKQALNSNYTKELVSTFGAPPGKVQLPSQSPEMATNNHQLVPILHCCSNRLGGGNHQEKQAKSAAQHEYQVPLDAITSSNALGFSLNLTKMMNQ